MAWSAAPSPSTTASLPLPSIGRCRCGPIRILPWTSACRRRAGIAFASTATGGSEGVAEEETPARPAGSSTRNQLDLLEQLVSPNSSENGYESDGSSCRITIREQLAELVGERRGEFTLPLGKRLTASANTLTISQKRNIKRQAYLNEVSRRNDSVFFATIGAFVILPPVVILAIAILTGYVQLFP